MTVRMEFGHEDFIVKHGTPLLYPAMMVGMQGSSKAAAATTPMGHRSLFSHHPALPSHLTPAMSTSRAPAPAADQALPLVPVPRQFLFGGHTCRIRAYLQMVGYRLATTFFVTQFRLICTIINLRVPVCTTVHRQCFEMPWAQEPQLFVITELHGLMLYTDEGPIKFQGQLLV